jgi:8-oxo-dGTP pyrophosphatase MutT (NUDIX family)
MENIRMQVAALPLRWDGDKLRVLLITSRETRRWVMPKGWPMNGRKSWQAAEIEALEEAGVTGRISQEPIGTYSYHKVLDDGSKVPVKVQLFPLYVRKLRRRWKERRERKRHWFSIKGAAKAVNEPDLEALLLSIRKRPHKAPAIRAILP